MTNPAPVPLALETLLERVDALRGQTPVGRSPTDGVRLRYIEALARRLKASAPALQKVLMPKLADALQAWESGCESKAALSEAAATAALPPDIDAPAASVRVAKKRVPALTANTAPAEVPLSLLGQLNAHIRQTSLGAAEGASPAPALTGGNPPKLPDLKSAVRFRETWARISAETEVDQATFRAPENAGPLNAHNLVLRTLGLMRELSPDYLRRFMGHTETLLWLDQAYGQLKQPAGKSKPGKQPKPSKQ